MVAWAWSVIVSEFGSFVFCARVQGECKGIAGCKMHSSDDGLSAHVMDLTSDEAQYGPQERLRLSRFPNPGCRES